jgi:lysophospholipase L1-like esterase
MFQLRSRPTRSPAALRVGVAALVLMAFGFGLAPSAQARASHDEEGHHHARYYLALGASYAFGYQQAKINAELAAGTYSPASFNTGYVDDFAHLLADDESQLQTVNYSCPSETTQSFISGDCQFHLSGLSLHDDYPATVSQLSTAVTFLNSHPHQVRIITIGLTELTGNALGALYFGRCHKDTACTIAAFPGFLAQTQAGADQILTALHTASPSSQIIVLQIFDPYMLALPISVPLFQQMSAVLASAATAHEAVLADGVTPFTPANLCTLTAACTPPLFDIHPTDQGYWVLARALWTAYNNDQGSTTDKQG